MILETLVKTKAIVDKIGDNIGNNIGYNIGEKICGINDTLTQSRNIYFNTFQYLPTHVPGVREYPLFGTGYRKMAFLAQATMSKIDHLRLDKLIFQCKLLDVKTGIFSGGEAFFSIFCHLVE